MRSSALHYDGIKDKTVEVLEGKKGARFKIAASGGTPVLTYSLEALSLAKILGGRLD